MVFFKLHEVRWKFQIDYFEGTQSNIRIVDQNEPKSGHEELVTHSQIYFFKKLNQKILNFLVLFFKPW